MITWDIVDGDLHVWFFDADPAADPPQQVVSSETGFTYAGGEPPTEVKSAAAFAEVTDAWPDLTDREIRIVGEAAMERIERR